MKRRDYWQRAFEAFNDGRVDEDTFDAMIMNADVFCDDDEEEDEEDPRDFIRDQFLSCRETPEVMTVDQAQAHISHFVLEGWNVPHDLESTCRGDERK